MGLFKSLFGPKVDKHQLIKEGALLIDVRSKNEFKAGHPEKAINMPLPNLSSQIEKIKKENKKVVTVCQSGMRSAQAKRLLKQSGIEAYNGGSWHNFA